MPRETFADRLNAVGVHLLQLFTRTNSLIPWRIGVALIRRAEAVARDEGDRRMYLGNLCEALRMRYERDGDPVHLDGAIEVGRRAVIGVTACGTDEAMRMAGLGVALRLRFDESGGDADDLDEAEKWCRLAVDCVPIDDPFRPAAERAVADVALSRYESYGGREVIGAAIDAYRVAAQPRPGRPADAAALAGLSVALRLCYDRFGGADTLAEAIDSADQAARATDDPAERAQYLGDLALALGSRYEATLALADAAEAVETHRSAVSLMPLRHPQRHVLEANLGRALRAYGQHADDIVSVREAVTLRRTALAAVPEDGHHRAEIESELAMDLIACFELTGEETALDEALVHARQAAKLSSGTPHEAAASTNLGHTLRTLYERSSDERYFEEALRVCRTAIDLAREDDESLPEYKSNLSNILLSGFEESGDRARLNEAIDLARSAAYDGSRWRTTEPGLLSNLGNLLTIRYETTGDLDSLREAVNAARQAAEASADRPADQPGHLANLGRTTLVLYERTRAREDLQDAITACRNAVAACRADDPDRPLYLHSLGNALYSRFEVEPSTDNIREALEAYRGALELCSATHRDRPMHLASLGMGLLGLGEHTGDPTVLDECVNVLHSAVREAAESDPERAKYLNNLGLALQARPAEHDAADARRAFQQAAQSPVAETTVRIHAGTEWGLAAGAAGRWREALDAFELCVGLLPQIAEPSLDRLDQEHRLTLFPDLSADAAVSALESETPEKALMLLEQARGVLLTQSLRMRPDAAALELISPRHAKRLEELRAALDSDADASARPTRRPAPDSRRYESRAAMVREREDLAAEIRSLPGLEQFQRMPTLDKLLEQASSGPVVFLNAHSRRSDALIATSQGLHITRLPNLAPPDVSALQTRFSAALQIISDQQTQRRERQRAEHDVSAVLRQLWDAVAEPVLDELGFTATPTAQERWPRMWWASTGPLASLPIHAAGYHDAEGPGGQSVLERVVSSYTPTIEALRHARARSGQVRPPRVLAVGMSHTPGEADLPGAEDEIEAVKRRFADESTVLLDNQATWKRVHDLLPEHSWAHFACHGVSDTVEPSASRLLLADHRERAFTVLDVSRLKLEHAELAVLSACETTRPADRLPGEAIHVTTAFQLAGFRQVIGTLWPVSDSVARRFVDHIYGSLLSDGSALPAGAVSVHAATHLLRDRYRAYPSIWSPFVHVGV